MEKKTKTKDYLGLTAGSVIAATGVYFFMIPADIVTGSITGLAMVLVHIIPMPISMMNLLLNVICLLLGFLLIGREFGAKTVYVSLLIPLIMRLYESVIPDITSLTGELVLDMVCLLIIMSIGQALLFQSKASSGGLDIIAKIMNKYLHIELGQAIIIAGGLVAFSTIFVYDVKTLIVGVLATYFNGLLVDVYISGFTRKKKVCIISKQYKRLQKYIVTDISRGATLYPVRGGYSNEDYMEIVTILDKNEYGRLMNYIQTEDPHAFVTISSVSEVVGMWNRKKKRA